MTYPYFFDKQTRIEKLQEIVGSDAAGRGMRNLLVPGDLLKAARIFSRPLNVSAPATLIVLSGFPCCINESPPTETDGPPGALAIARAGQELGYRVIVVTDDCNGLVFQAACQDKFELQTFPATFSKDDEDTFQKLAESCTLLIACERAGPGPDGKCRTMRGIDMEGLVAPLHRFRDECQAPFLAVGDGGNELGMGSVIENIRKHIPLGDTIGCVVSADHVIAASVSNWGGYALAAAAALVRADETDVELWLERCLPTRNDEIELLNRCVAAGCRDGVSGKMEATVDGLPLERSLQCLEEIRAAALGK